MDFRQLQKEQFEWAEANFPEAKPYQPLLGVVEELGELAHAHLKMEQRIRGSFAEHFFAKEDAIGDVVIYLADYCSRNGIDFQRVVERTWQQVSKRDWKANPATGRAEKTENPLNVPFHRGSISEYVRQCEFGEGNYTGEDYDEDVLPRTWRESFEYVENPPIESSAELPLTVDESL